MEIWSESTEFNTSQILADKVRRILKEGDFLDFEIQEIYGQG